MSESSVQQFIEAVNESDDLQGKCRDALDGAENASGLVSVAKDSGYEISEADVTSFFGEVLGAEQPGALSDTELEAVAGGAGSKDSPSPATRLGQTVRFFRGLKLSQTPRWTGFR